MTPLDSIGRFQQLVMLAALRLGEDAYGARIQEELERVAGRSVAISSIYVTMERLEKKDLVRSWLGDPTPVRGGRAKRFYQLTEAGVRTLAEARAELDRMWSGLEKHPAFEGRP
jgi:DNA-binding PadR family transcriptional regulator